MDRMAGEYQVPKERVDHVEVDNTENIKSPYQNQSETVRDDEAKEWRRIMPIRDSAAREWKKKEK
ncbi:hypothetical protein [[Clostridium] scindens]|uniref:hypothetical protein n=2 Tax=Clostridium scindens (strain JCM 10418 / VPI 12708) TaxID=29347 RepID=UPI00242FF6F3|nr:hypothetical protein [[Clostridium] scindens]